MTDLSASKSDLRRQLRARRRDLAALIPGAAEQAAAHWPITLLGRFAVAAGYHPVGGELDPWPLLRRLQAAGARIALPAAPAPGAPLIFRAHESGQPLEPDAARVPSPNAAAPTLIPDLIIAPLLAFDGAGFRLGQGGGYYDRTLEALRAAGSVFVVGLAYAGQAVDHAPRDDHDQPLDAILTETGYHRFRKDTECA
jgi:5-formyltetrahydrofolate cyclo-ligase